MEIKLTETLSSLRGLAVARMVCTVMPLHLVGVGPVVSYIRQAYIEPLYRVTLI